MKSLPSSETKTPGVECRTLKGETYVITGNETRNKFTLWKEWKEGYEKLLTAKSPLNLYEKIPWR